MSVLRRYELERQGDQVFGRLSGGQQARFQILLLELQGIQQRLFRAQIELADAAQINVDLERQIRAAERELFRIQGLVPGGGKGP